jgi:hypothetical protein
MKNCDLEKFRALVLSKLYKINVEKKMMMAIFGTVFNYYNTFTSSPERIEIAKFCHQLVGKKIYLRTYKNIHEKVLFDFILPQNFAFDDCTSRISGDEKTLWFLANSFCMRRNVMEEQDVSVNVTEARDMKHDNVNVTGNYIDVCYVFEHKKIKEKNILQFTSQPSWVREDVPASFVCWI